MSSRATREPTLQDALPDARASNGRTTTRRTRGCWSIWTWPTRAPGSDNDPLGNHIPEALQATAEAGITERKLGPWTTSLFGRYFGPRSLLEDNSVKSTSTTLFNAQTTYEVNKQLRLRFDVFNIFDRKADDITYYYRSRLPGEPADGVNDIHFHPVERRSLRVATLIKF